jgi:hypothetical protein
MPLCTKLNEKSLRLHSEGNNKLESSIRFARKMSSKDRFVKPIYQVIKLLSVKCQLSFVHLTGATFYVVLKFSKQDSNNNM